MKKGLHRIALLLAGLCLGACAQNPFHKEAARSEPVSAERRAEIAEIALAADEERGVAAERAPENDVARPAPTSKDPLTEDKDDADFAAGTGRLINLDAARKVPRKVPEKGKASLNFADMPIADVVKMILGDLLNENYVIAAGVSGTVTFSTARPVTPEQAFSVLEMLLSWNNLALVYVDGQYSVVPSANAVRGNLTPRVGPASLARGYEVRAVPLEYIAATEMEKLLQPYAKEGSILKADNSRSLIVLAGSKRELENYMSTIEVFDVDWIKGMSIGMITLEQTEAKTMAPELDQIFGEQSGSPLSGMFRFVPIERLNAILVITPQKRYLAEAEKWISRLDRGGNTPGVRLYVYDVKNVKATDLADRLNEIFGSSGSTSNTSSAAGNVAPGLVPVELSSSSGTSMNLSSPGDNKTSIEKRNTPYVNNSNPNSPDTSFRPATVPGAPVVAVNGDQGLAIVEGEEIRITAVEENNQLIVRATPAQYEAISGAVRKLDTVPLQVHIEARLLDVTLNNNLKFGVQWYFENALGNLPHLAPEDPGDGTSTLKRAIDGDREGQILPGGLSWVFAGRRAGALVTMLQKEGNAKVLSAPSVMVLNNTEALINIGQQIPVVSSFVNPITTPGTGQTQNQVQFRDTGIILNVKPRVNPGGLVFMEIKAEQSTPVPPDESAPVGGNVAVDKKTIETEVAVQSGDTILLGGLIQQNDSDGQSGVPGLMKIPLLGRLFSTSSRDNTRKELLVLITPTVVRGGAEEARELTEEYKKRFLGLEPLIKDMEDAERARQEVEVK